MLNFNGMTVKNDWNKIQSLIAEHFGVPRHASVYVRHDGKRRNIALRWTVKNQTNDPYGGQKLIMISCPILWELLDAVPYE